VGGLPVITKKLVGHVDNTAYSSVTVDIQATLVTPAAAEGPVPVIIEFSFDPVLMRKFFKRIAARGVKPPPTPPGPTWQQQILASGAALYRRNFGERLENAAGTGEYHWVAGNFIKYVGPLTPNDLPVDSLTN
jgi:hypothetical protein